METENRLKAVVIDKVTGEILQEKESNEIKITTKEEKEKIKEQIEYRRTSKEFKQLQQNVCGNFVFFLYQNMDNLTKILNDNDLVKFIFLGTYVKEKGILMLDDKTTYIDKRMLKKMLRLKDRAFTDFYTKIKDNNLLKEENNKLYVTIEYFYKGTNNKYKKLTHNNLKNFSRIYIKATRELYEQTNLRSFRKLAIAYKLIPYTNWKYNILCFNPEEFKKEDLDVITIKDVLNICNYDISHLARFKKDFYTIKYNNHGIFASVQKHEDYIKSFILVNPLLFFKGSERKDLEYLLTVFNIKIN